MSGRHELLVELTSVAEACEGVGALNLGKTCRAAEQSLRVQAADAVRSSDPRGALPGRLRRVARLLESSSLAPELVERIRHGARLVEQGGALPHEDFPDPLVCRRCGRVGDEETESCPGCGAHRLTFRRHRPSYWLSAYGPSDVVSRLDANPTLVAAAVEAFGGEGLDRSPRAGVWSATEVLRHLLSSELLLSRRVTLLLTEDDPSLHARPDEPPDLAEPVEHVASGHLERYRISRRTTVARLPSIGSPEWRRRGWHVEYGWVTLAEQASYFAAHELTHLRQLEELRRAAPDDRTRRETQ